MDDARQTKRARQACEPCRRKKSKCPGERPTCSFCERLGQQCVYNSGDADSHQARHNRKIEYRIEHLEGKMDQLIEQLGPIVTAEEISAMARASRRMVMARITEGQIGLSTLQTLCLLSIVDFADGKPVQAGLNVAMASHVVQSFLPDGSLGDAKEYNDCLQSITMLQRLQGCVSSTCNMSGGISSQLDDGLTEPGIIHYAAQLTEVWQMARQYAACRVTPDAPPPWSSKSDYTSVMQRHMEIDCSVPLKYRFYSKKFGDYDHDTLQRRRDYWGPWLFIQIVYAAVPCLLNHPFLLSMRLRNCRLPMPQSFIQQSFEHITRHAGWIVYFLDLLEKKFFQASDATLAHCVAVVATIHLQHSFVRDRSLRDKAQDGFEKCMKFLRRMGAIWANVAIIAENLTKLQESVVVVPSPAPSGPSHEPLPQSFSIDAQLLWDILIYERAGRPGASADQSIFHDPETSTTPLRESRMGNCPAEFDLVGSAGISGHKAALKEIPAYAPAEDDGVRTGAPARLSDPEPELPSTARVADGWHFEGIGGVSEQDSLFLQPDDFGRAIEGWLNSDIV
ncbi:Zn(II)2Cys6 transcription factor [Pleurostoma richardsiae]|uniref:Zn(II)2Cys6 transcription factor n=1 Tax=Pleurostoma richardsiae TaxID=41990 RepID=A0AA38S000_9PEZI|nr:Zn(II)2Cys6 transcription factor [Pleurostoma richardsiae]